ncbi:MAG: deoxyhypusine synthase [Nitrososphaeria archaeon]|nr:deoxyhypusine synthase [Conexivisphaerales archaeon]
MQGEPVKDIVLEKNDAPFSLLKKMAKAGGFSGREMGEALDYLKELFSGDYGRILTFPADIIATGLRGVITQLIKLKMFDLVITTCGALDHDIARSFSNYYEGSYFEDDVKLREKGIHRLGNVFIPLENYGPLIEKKMQELLTSEYAKKTKTPTYTLAWDIGKMINNESSFLYWAYKNQIPVVVPGITDGAVGYQLWLFKQSHRDFTVDALEDEQLVSDFVYSHKKLGALIIGGGISKHHAIWWSQFRDGLEIAVYVTTAYEYDGSLSGALTREAISWGKIKPRGKHVTVHGDATIVLPFLIHGVLYG